MTEKSFYNLAGRRKHPEIPVDAEMESLRLVEDENIQLVYKTDSESITVVITPEEYDQEKAFYERDTGCCFDCRGTKQQWAGWGADTGTRYVPCRRCGATGRAPAAPADSRSQGQTS